MDKSWMQKPRNTEAYYDGAREFIKFADSRGAVYDGRLKCPCIKCCNVYYQDVKTTYDHIIWHGIGKSYTTWFFHGKNNTSSSITRDEALDDNTMQLDWMIILALDDNTLVEEDDNTIDDMRGMLHDLCGVLSEEEIHDSLRRDTEEDGVELSRANIVKIAYTQKDGTPSNSVVADALEKINRQQEKQLEGSRDPPGREDVLSQVFEEDRPGRCRILGVGPTQSREWGGKSNSQMSKQGEMTCLRSKIGKLEERKKELEKCKTEMQKEIERWKRRYASTMTK